MRGWWSQAEGHSRSITRSHICVASERRAPWGRRATSALAWVKTHERRTRASATEMAPMVGTGGGSGGISGNGGSNCRGTEAAEEAEAMAAATAVAVAAAAVAATLAAPLAAMVVATVAATDVSLRQHLASVARPRSNAW